LFLQKNFGMERTILMSRKKSFYAVWKGRETGVFYNWVDCEKSVKGYSNAIYEGFYTEEDAKNAFEIGYEQYKIDAEKKESESNQNPFQETRLW
jgi:ribonuclease HI